MSWFVRSPTKIPIPGAWLDVLHCRCAGRREVKAYVTSREKIRETLERLGLWREAPKLKMARGPPKLELGDWPSGSDGVDPPAPESVA